MNRITYFLLPLFDISKNEKTLHIIDTQGFFCLLQYLSTAFLPPPSGAQTLNPNIESVVSTSRTKTKFLSVTN